MLHNIMYSTWSLLQLKSELKKRGAALSGKKADLVDRLGAYDRNFNFGQVICSQENSQIELPSPEAYRDVNASSTLPKLTKQHIQGYFDRFNKNISDAYKLYEACYLLILRSCISGGKTYVKGFCKASMKQNLQYEINIKFGEDGMPEESTCECAAGAGTEAHCKHVAVVLFGVSSMAYEKFVLLHEVPTQKLQTFHRPSKKYVASPIVSSKLPTKRQIKSVVFSP